MCCSLANAGFEVYLVVANAQSEVRSGVRIVGVEVPFAGRLSRMRKAARAVYDKALELDASLYHIHDPELLPYALKLQKKGKKVIFDSHEDVPADILDKSWLGPLALRKLISYVYKVYEKRSVRRLSGLVSVLDPITQGFKHPRGITIHNYPKVDYFNMPKHDFGEESEPKFRLIYNGGLTRIRGIHHIIDAMDGLDEGYELLLMGPWESDSYAQECKDLSGWARVRYMGMLDIHTCFGMLKAAQLGMLLFGPVPNHLQSLPNKSFEYIAAGIPMLMSDFPFWRKEFGDYAHFVNPQNPVAIASAVSSIANDYAAVHARCTNLGKKILASKTWKREAERLVDYYHQLLN